MSDSDASFSRLAGRCSMHDTVRTLGISKSYIDLLKKHFNERLMKHPLRQISWGRLYFGRGDAGFCCMVRDDLSCKTVWLQDSTLQRSTLHSQRMHDVYGRWKRHIDRQADLVPDFQLSPDMRFIHCSPATLGNISCCSDNPVRQAMIATKQTLLESGFNHHEVDIHV